jgi:type IV fimbrial biogenesis protein FimT
MIRHGYAGMTMIDMLATMLILTLTLSIGAPSLSAWIADAQISAHASALHNALAYARGEAIRRAADVTVCVRNPGSPGSACANTGHDWSPGWLVIVDQAVLAGSHTPVIAEVLRVENGLSDSIAMTFNAPRGSAFTFDALGRPARNFVGGTFSICSRKYTRPGKQIIVSYLGRVRTVAADCVAPKP